VRHVRVQRLLRGLIGERGTQWPLVLLYPSLGMKGVVQKPTCEGRRPEHKNRPVRRLRRAANAGNYLRLSADSGIDEMVSLCRNRITVCQLLHTLQVGGAEVLAARLARQLG